MNKKIEEIQNLGKTPLDILIDTVSVSTMFKVLSELPIEKWEEIKISPHFSAEHSKVFILSIYKYYQNNNITPRQLKWVKYYYNRYIGGKAEEG